MCGRFALTLPRDAVLEHFKAAPWEDDDLLDRPRYNIRPTEKIWAVARDEDGARRLTAMRWGFLPHWAKSPSDGPPLINARSETIAEKPAFKKSARERRCLVPADGFYEWTTRLDDAGKPVKTPHWIHPAAGGLIAFAAVWRAWRGADGAETPSVAIVTVAANQAMSALHERLPLVVAPSDYGLWLGEEGAGAATLMRAPAEDFYAHHAVSRMINKGGRHAPDGPELRLPAEPEAPDASQERLL